MARVTLCIFPGYAPVIFTQVWPGYLPGYGPSIYLGMVRVFTRVWSGYSPGCDRYNQILFPSTPEFMYTLLNTPVGALYNAPYPGSEHLDQSKMLPLKPGIQ